MLGELLNSPPHSPAPSPLLVPSIFSPAPHPFAHLRRRRGLCSTIFSSACLSIVLSDAALILRTFSPVFLFFSLAGRKKISYSTRTTIFLPSPYYLEFIFLCVEGWTFSLHRCLRAPVPSFFFLLREGVLFLLLHPAAEPVGNDCYHKTIVWPRLQKKKKGRKNVLDLYVVL